MSSMFTSALTGESSPAVYAYLDDDTIIVVKISGPLPLDASDVTVIDATTARVIPVLSVVLPQAEGTGLIEVALAEAPDVTHCLHIALKGNIQSNVTPRKVLNGEQYL